MNGRQHAVRFSESVFSVPAFPLAFWRAHGGWTDFRRDNISLALLSDVLLFHGLLLLQHYAGVLFSALPVVWAPQLTNVFAPWDKRWAFNRRSTGTSKCNLKCLYTNLFLQPSILIGTLSGTSTCGESRVWLICQRYYSIKVYDRRCAGSSRRGHADGAWSCQTP